MQITQETAPDLSIINAFKFTWTNQGKLFRLLACPLLMMLAYTTENFLSGIQEDACMAANGSECAHGGGEFALGIGLFILQVMATFMIMVRLYRFILLNEDASQTPFFSFGKRELKTLAYSIPLLVFVFLFTLPPSGAYIIQFGILALLGSGSIFWTVGVLLFIYLALRLSLIFPAIALDRPISFSGAWKEMRGFSSRFIVKFFLAATLIFGAKLSLLIATMVLLDEVAIPPNTTLIFAIHILSTLFYMWVTVFGYTLVYRIISNLYRYKVLDRE